MDGKIRRKKGKRERLVTAFFFMIFFCMPVIAEEYAGQIILEKTSFLVNEEFKLSILIPEIPPAKLSVEEPAVPEGLVFLKGPFTRPGRNGSIIDYYLQPVREGRYVIDSFTILSSGKTLLTTPVFITAATTFQIQGSFDKVPPGIKWDIPDEKFYPGEAVPLRFVIENLETTDIIIESAVSRKPEGYVKKTSRLAEKNERIIIPKTVMTGEIYDVLFHDHIFVSFGTGNVMLPDVEIFLSRGEAGYRTILKGVPITIHRAPGSGSGTGAIGNYSYKYEISGKTISNAQGILIKQKIWGKGNFYGINVPPPYVDNPLIAEISILKDKSDAVPDGKLFTGYREVTYSLRKKKGPEMPSSVHGGSAVPPPEFIKLVIPDFTWYEENYTKLPPGMGLKKAPGGVEEIKIPESFSSETPAENGTGKSASGSDIARILTIVLAAALIPAVFLITSKNMKKSFAAAITLIFLVATLFVIKTVYMKPPLYGIVFSDLPPVPVFSIPEETGTMKFRLEIGDRVRITDESNSYYLIETPESGGGWINKNNLILE